MLFPTDPGSAFVHDGQRYVIPRVAASGGAWRDAQLGRNEHVTKLVLGSPQYRALPGERLLRRIRQRLMTFEYYVHGDEHLQLFDTERAARARIGRVDFQLGKREASLKRFSIATTRDQDELTLAAAAVPSLRVREKCGSLARRIVQLDIESRRAALLTNPANYPVANTLTLAPGSEWDSAGGDSFATVDAVCLEIMRHTGLQKDDLTVYLSHSAYRAAQKDPTWRASRAGITDKLPRLDDMRDYWQVGNVWKGDARVTRDGVVGSLYGDVCIIYYAGDDADLDTEYGDLTWAVEFRRNGGLAARPYYDHDHTSWCFPWNDYAHQAITSPGSGGLILNCSTEA